ncbi:MAG: hypothetical protein OHK0052_02880 [Anaerolineales bacterium]
MKNPTLRWTFIIIAVLTLILLPFALFGDAIDAWTAAFLETAQRSWVSALVLGGLLAADILIPTPSSLVSTAAGFLLGFLPGTLTSTVGMMTSCLIGYELGRRMGRPFVLRMVGEKELLRLENLYARLGDWVIVVCRPIPVLGEASVLFAGAGTLNWTHFAGLSLLSNLVISLVYAAVGAFAADVNSFLLAFFGSITVPGIIMWLARQRLQSKTTASQNSTDGD